MSYDFYKILEFFAALTGLLNIYLITQRSIWNYLFGSLTVSIFLIIFYHVKLYADMGLQVVYLFLQLYGYYQWLYGGKCHTQLGIKKAAQNEIILALVVMVLLAALLSLLLRYTDSTTIILDAITTALSLVAQWMMSKKWLQNWWFWLVMNSISLIMYSVKGLYITTGLYAVYFMLCVYGYYQWRTEFRMKPAINHRVGCIQLD